MAEAGTQKAWDGWVAPWHRREDVEALAAAAREHPLTLADGLAWSLLLLGFVANAVLVLGVSAPYGRYSRKGWGPMLPARVAWVTQEAPSLLLPLYLLPGHRPECLRSPGTAALLTAFLAHYFHRAVVYPLRLRGGKPTPAAVWLLALAFCVYNGFLQGYQLLRTETCATPVDTEFVAGGVLWVAGLLINLHSDGILRALRKPGEKGYKIPKGGLFEYVSGANFFGECVEWTGFALAARTLPAAAFAAFTWLNLGPRALQHHQFYLDKFKEEYPKLQRKALVPFLL